MVVVAVLVILKPLLLLSLVFFLSVLVFFLFLLLLLLLLSLSSLLLLLLLLLLCHCLCRCCCCFCYYPNCSRAQRKQQGLQFRCSEKRGVRGREKAAKCAVQKRGGGWEGGGGARSLPAPLSTNLPLMTLFSSLLPPKAISRGFSILCVGEEAFTHLFVLQRRLSFALLCFHAFLLPSEYVWLSPSCLSVKTFHS